MGVSPPSPPSFPLLSFLSVSTVRGRVGAGILLLGPSSAAPVMSPGSL